MDFLKKKEEEALVKREYVALTSRPDFVQDGDQRGTEHIQKDDLQMPRLTLAQALSPQMQEGDPSQIEDLKVGLMFNNLTSEILGKGPIMFTIVRADRPRGIEFYPLKEGGGIKDFDVELTDPRMVFGPDGEKPVATKFYDFIILMLPKREPIALSLKGTGLKTARQLNALMKIRGAPSFAGKYSLRTAMLTNKKGTFAVFQIKNAGWVTKEEFEYAGAMYESIKDRPLVIEREAEIDSEGLPKESPF